MEQKFGARDGGQKFAELVTIPDGGLQCLIQAKGFSGFKIPENLGGGVVTDDISFATYIWEAAGVKLLPGQGCGFIGSEMIFRTTISKEQDKLKDAFRKIRDCCLALQPPTRDIHVSSSSPLVGDGVGSRDSRDK